MLGVEVEKAYAAAALARRIEGNAAGGRGGKSVPETAPTSEPTKARNLAARDVGVAPSSVA